MTSYGERAANDKAVRNRFVFNELIVFVAVTRSRDLQVTVAEQSLSIRRDLKVTATNFETLFLLLCSKTYISM